MDILYLLVPLSVVLVLVAGALFWLALRSGQFEDLERGGFSILADDDRPQAADPPYVPGPIDLDQRQASHTDATCGQQRGGERP